MCVRAALCSAVILLSLPARAETPAQWIELGARVHGAFGAFIPIGIRIGLDAKERIKAEARGLAVTYCAGEKAPAGLLAVVVVRNRKTGEGLRYTVADAWLPKVLEWNKTSDPAGRFDAAMKAEGLFEVTPAPAP